MKKTFISLFLLSLLTVFGSLSVNANPVASLSFVYTSAGNDYYCNGNASESGKGALGGDFQWSGKIEDAIQKSGDWIGVNGNTRACSRSTSRVHLNATGDYTFTMDVKWTEHGNRNLPRITITGQSEKTPDMGSSVYFNDNETKTIVYTFNGLAAGDYDISVYFQDGARDKQFVKTLVIASSAPATPTYEVSATASNGTVSGTGSYAEGAEVTLTASPNENYSFTGWSSSDISIAAASANPLVFTMPGKAVSVTANFTECTKHTVTLTDDGNGSTSGGGLQCDGSVTVTATPNSGYRFVNWTNTSTSDVVSTDAAYTFDLSADISLTANFEVNPCTDTKLVEAEDYIDGFSAYHFPNGSPQIESDASLSNGKFFNFNGNDDGKDGEINFYVYLPAATYSIEIKHRNGKDKYLNIYSEDPDGDVTYNTVKYKKMNAYNPNLGDDYCGDWKTFTYNNVELTTDGYYLIGLYGKQYAMFDYIKFTANTGVFCPNTITMQKSGDASAADPTSSPANTAMAGTVVTVTAGEASANHNFVNWTASPSVEFVNANASSTTFVMPAEDVTITANYGAIVLSALTFAAGEGGAVVSATAGGDPISSGDEVISGTSVTLTAAANSNYVFINWTDNNNNAVVSTNAAFTFSMPATATAYTAHFAQIDNVISQGSETGSDKGNSGGGASIAESHIADFDAFGHNVVKLTYSNMSGSSAYCGWNIGKSGSYNSASSAGATGFGFYYKTEAADDAVAMWFDPNTGNHADQRGMQLEATENVWKYVYIEHAVANGWNHDNIIIYINGDQEEKTTAKASGAIYIADIAATSITLKPEKANYHYINDRGGTMQVDDYGTLCLPMGGTITGATLYSVAGKETGDINYLVLEEEGNTIVAGKPYITQSTATSYTVTMSGAHSAVQDGNGLVGTYVTIDPLTPYNESGPHNYFLYANAFKKAGTGVTVGAYRAYLNWDAVIAAPAQAPSARRIRMVIEGKEDQTGMETVTAMPKTTKVLIDGQLFIIREGKRYTLTGARAQ